MGSLEGRTKGYTNAERELHYPFKVQPKSDKVTDHHQLLCRSPHVTLPSEGIALADEQKYSRVGQKSRISGLLKPTIFGAKPKQQMETHAGSQQIPYGREIQNGDSRDSLQAGELSRS